MVVVGAAMDEWMDLPTSRLTDGETLLWRCKDAAKNIALNFYMVMMVNVVTCKPLVPIANDAINFFGPQASFLPAGNHGFSLVMKSNAKLLVMVPEMKEYQFSRR